MYNFTYYFVHVYCILYKLTWRHQPEGEGTKPDEDCRIGKPAAQLIGMSTVKSFATTTENVEGERSDFYFRPTKGGGGRARSINLPSTASMEGGTLLFEGAHLIDAIRSFVAKQANVVITPFFWQTPLDLIQLCPI